MFDMHEGLSKDFLWIFEVVGNFHLFYLPCDFLVKFDDEPSLKHKKIILVVLQTVEKK